ncbi:MAG: hypothetical protein LUC41_03580 [Clostridiales bacterium]|nr:hypothetical protein [Clostridiales bacterium]
MQRISDENWTRADLVEKYSTYVFPYINLGVELDVTGLYRFAKENGLSFYCAMMHTAIKAALTIENFRYRLVEGEPYLCEKLDPSFVHLAKGQERFLVVHGEYREDIVDFCRVNMEKMREAEQGRQIRGKISAESSKEILYITCIPWVKYTHFVRTIEDARTDNIPRLSWGKYEENERGRLMMPFSVQVHHALMDGYHVGIYMQRVQNILDLFTR